MSVPVPPGWYPDPLDGSRQRYWDGGSWTDHVSDAPTPQVAPQEPGFASDPGEGDDAKPVWPWAGAWARWNQFLDRTGGNRQRPTRPGPTRRSSGAGRAGRNAPLIAVLIIAVPVAILVVMGLRSAADRAAEPPAARPSATTVPTPTPTQVVPSPGWSSPKPLPPITPGPSDDGTVNPNPSPSTSPTDSPVLPPSEAAVAAELSPDMNPDLARRALVIDIEVRNRSAKSPVSTEWLAINGITLDDFTTSGVVVGCDVRESRYGPIGFDYLHSARITCVTALQQRRESARRLLRAHPRWDATVAVGWQANITITVPGTPNVSAGDFALALRAAGLPTGPGDVKDTPLDTTGAGSGFIVNGYPLTDGQVTVMSTILADLTARQPTVSPGPPAPVLPPPA